MEFDFASNPIVKSLDDVPDWARPLYDGEATDDGHPLRDDLKATAAAYDGINKALANARKAEREMKRTKLTPWLELGESPEAIKTEMDDLREQVKSASSGKVNLDKMKADMDKTIAEANAAKDSEIGQMQRSLEKSLIEREIVAALAAEAPDSVDLLLPHVRAQMRMFKDGEDYVSRVVDAQGDARGDGKGGYMGAIDLVREMKGIDKYAIAYPSPNRAGSGTGPGSSDTGRRQSANGAQMTTKEMYKEGLRQRGL